MYTWLGNTLFPTSRMRSSKPEFILMKKFFLQSKPAAAALKLTDNMFVRKFSCPHITLLVSASLASLIVLLLFAVLFAAIENLKCSLSFPFKQPALFWPSLVSTFSVLLRAQPAHLTKMLPLLQLYIRNTLENFERCRCVWLFMWIFFCCYFSLSIAITTRFYLSFEMHLRCVWVAMAKGKREWEEQKRLLQP